MGKLEKALELIKSGVRTPEALAERLNTSTEEVDGMLKILESLGYIERVEIGPSCESCPLKKICPGSCIVFKGNVYELGKKAFSLDGDDDF
ncbi:FeoC-like transcriptional regulator [Palaeococcus ferrophilus]|uniref:FeoC-like transcriptional regulator n=1 Tax=Palaeococcus ferrophilus TaxID=83868 RepID=UPI00064F074C|nr:FeoC-like transcriptional regulator [Palaeococcus ferrophilus]